MKSLEAVRAMLDASKLTPYRASLRIGRNSTYLAGMLRRGSCPSADLLAKIARACGYRLELVPLDGAGDSLTIDGGGGGSAG